MDPKFTSPIKMRVWDDEQKKMFYGKWEQFDDSLLFRFRHFETETPIYMLFSGIKDDNGKDIYAGDVVEYVDGKGIVKYEPSIGCFCIALPIRRKVWTIAIPDLFKDPDGISLKVIGNIYENPDCLPELTDLDSIVGLKDM